MAYRPCCCTFSALAVVHVDTNPPPVGIGVAKQLQLFQTFREPCIFVCLLWWLASLHQSSMLCSRHLGLIATGSTDCVIAVRESYTQRILKMRVLECWSGSCVLYVAQPRYLKLRILSCLLGHKTGTVLCRRDILAIHAPLRQ